MHRAAPDIQRRTHDAVRRKPFHRKHDTDDIDDRVEGTDLVQVHLLDRHLMDRGFCLRQTLKHRLRPGATGDRETGAVDQRKDLAQAAVAVAGSCSMGVIARMSIIVRVAVFMVVRILRGPIVAVFVDAELGRSNARAQHPRGMHVGVAQRERTQRALQLFERQTGVETGAERHVAGDARKAIEVHHLSQSSHLLETEVPPVAEDDVIHDVDAHQETRGHQPPGQARILRARARIA